MWILLATISSHAYWGFALGPGCHVSQVSPLLCHIARSVSKLSELHAWTEQPSSNGREGKKGSNIKSGIVREIVPEGSALPPKQPAVPQILPCCPCKAGAEPRRLSREHKYIMLLFMVWERKAHCFG